MSEEVKRLAAANWKPEPEFYPAESANQAVEGIAALDHAISLEPKSALMHLTRASLLDNVRRWLPSSKLKEIPPQLGAVTAAEVRKGFLTAWRLSVGEEMKEKEHPWPGRFLTDEAGSKWLELCRKADAQLPRAEREMIPVVESSLRRLAAKPPASTISPIIFSFEQNAADSIHDLIDPNARIAFDLRGRGAVETWTWICPTTCFLVWDPGETGIITSGRQLFGNATFQLVCSDGFEAMRLLDDNADGILSGHELSGLAVWQDRNSDGVSSAAEVTPVEKTSIVSIAVTANGFEDDLHPKSSRGLTLSDGTTRPVWDWFASPAGSGLP